MSVQWVAAALQKLTWPTVTGVVPASTVAVSVTTLPEVSVVTALPPEATASVVVVAAGCAHAWPAPPLVAIAAMTKMRRHFIRPPESGLRLSLTIVSPGDPRKHG
jgi:hypothetical protein